MNGLLNPYRCPTATGRAPFGAARSLALAVVGAAVVTGCGGPGEDTAAPPEPGPTMPVPTATAEPAPAPAPTTAPPTVSTDDSGGGVPPASGPGPAQLEQPGADHTVVRGDTLSELALRFDVPGGWPTLFERNADVLRDPDLILVGQQLDIDGNP